MDTLIPSALALYGLLLLILIISPHRRWAVPLLVVGVVIRFACTGLRTTVGSDVAAYTMVLSQCDLTVINALELFWYAGCMPSHYMSLLIDLPFLWIGLLDTVLFWFIARKGGMRLAAFHDLVYLQSTGMGAIRQALAMKLMILAVLVYLESSRRPDWRANRLMLLTPFIHLAAIVPTAAMMFKWSNIWIRLLILGLPLVAAAYLIDQTLIDKIEFYLSFEGFRSADAIYGSWIKRIFLVTGVLLLARPPRLVWGIYLIGLVIAGSEFWIPEIAVRIGAYFEQFEVLLLAAPMKPRMRKLGLIWYAMVGLAYTARFILNISSLPQ